MGQEPRGVATREPSREDVNRLERDIERGRERLSGLVAEIDRRRHEAISPKAHPILAAVVLSVAGLGTAAAWFVLRRRARARRRSEKIRRVGNALSRAAAHPERVAARQAGAVWKLALAVAPLLAKKLAERAFARTPPRRRTAG